MSLGRFGPVSAEREGEGKNADLLIPLGEEKRSEFEVKF